METPDIKPLKATSDVDGLDIRLTEADISDIFIGVRDDKLLDERSVGYAELSFRVGNAISPSANDNLFGQCAYVRPAVDSLAQPGSTVVVIQQVLYVAYLAQAAQFIGLGRHISFINGEE
jgi:hypothetical protein